MNISRIARICVFFQLHRLAYFLNRNRKRIITFHNVLDDNLFQQNIANLFTYKLSDFSKVIDKIGKRYRFSTDINDTKTVTITFDDGYCNQAETAGKHLMKKGIPAYLFVSGQLIDGGRNAENNALSIDRVLHWVDYVPDGMYVLEYAGDKYELHILKENRRQIWATVLWPLFCSDSERKGEGVMEALDKIYPYSRILAKLDAKYVKQRLTGITLEQIEELKRAGWKIGWHSQSHYVTANLKYEDKMKELTPSPICNCKILSYPFGDADAVDKETFDIAEILGYETGMSNIDFGNKYIGNSYRTRFSMSMDMSMLHFEFSGLKYLLKYRKLLPKI